MIWIVLNVSNYSLNSFKICIIKICVCFKSTDFVNYMFIAFSCKDKLLVTEKGNKQEFQKGFEVKLNL